MVTAMVMGNGDGDDGGDSDGDGDDGDGDVDLVADDSVVFEFGIRGVAASRRPFRFLAMVLVVGLGAAGLRAVFIIIRRLLAPPPSGRVTPKD